MAKVLCVDDVSSNLGLARDVVSRVEGVEVVLANNVHTALDLAKVHAPQVIVLDILMPQMDGYELLRKLKALPELSKSRYIALTALARPEDQTQALTAGFHHYISKPFDILELMQVVRAFLR